MKKPDIKGQTPQQIAYRYMNYSSFHTKDAEADVRREVENLRLEFMQQEDNNAAEHLMEEVIFFEEVLDDLKDNW